MVYLRDSEFCWLSQLQHMAGNVAEKVKPGLSKTFFKKRPAGEWRSFELADDMERGLAREVTISFITPPPQGAESRRLVVERSQDQAEYVLSSENGEPLLIASTRTGNAEVEIYIPTGGNHPVAVGPAFVLSGDDSGKGWTLSSDRCECCEYLPEARACCSSMCRRQVARIRHRREVIGKGRIMTIEVDLPKLREDGTPEAWCPRSTQERSRVRLESRRPTWSTRIQNLTLDFCGRCTKASPKNIQLQTEGGPVQVAGKKLPEPELLFGKIDDDTFVLDYKHPLGMAQAFGIALTTKDWK